MHTSGHVGIGFGASAVLVVALPAAGLGEFAIAATALLVGLSPLPDVDERIPRTAHRGGTHSVPFALLVGLVTAAGVTVLGAHPAGADRLTPGLLAFAIGFLAVALHVLADVLTPMGVYLLWPLSPERRSLGIVRSADPTANRLALAVGLGSWLLAMGLVHWP